MQDVEWKVGEARLPPLYKELAGGLNLSCKRAVFTAAKSHSGSNPETTWCWWCRAGRSSYIADAFVGNNRLTGRPRTLQTRILGKSHNTDKKGQEGVLRTPTLMTCGPPTHSFGSGPANRDPTPGAGALTTHRSGHAWLTNGRCGAHRRISRTGMEPCWFCTGWQTCFPTCACCGQTAATPEALDTCWRNTFPGFWTLSV